MTTSALSPASVVTSVAAENSPPVVGESRSPDALFAALRLALRQHLDQPSDLELWHRLLAVRRTAAEAIAQLPRQQKDTPTATDARQLVREITASGIHDTALTETDRTLIDRFARGSWPSLLAAMLLAPAWQWRAAPALQDVPDWLWGDYAAWLFAAPQGFTAVGQTTVYAAHHLNRSQELLRWTLRNRGSNSVRAALAAYVAGATAIPLYFSPGDLKIHAAVRGQLLTIAHGLAQSADDFLSPPLPRDGRRLRVGFVNRHFGSQTETYTTLPSFEHLDPDRFEVCLFTLHANPGPLENYARSRAAAFQVLSGDLAEQTATLRAAMLDVVVFGTNVTAVVNEVTLLALHRIAPLQVINNSSCITSGLPAADLYISGTLTEAPDAPTQFTERLGLLPGPAHAFNYQADASTPTVQPTRAALGIPEDATVFVSAANYFKIIPEMQVAWARLLAAVPGAYLLIHPFNPNWSSSYPIARFCAEFDRMLEEHGVATNRLVVSANKFSSRTDVKELLRIGDVYLDTFPFGGVNSLVDPLELGIPVVAWEGATFRSRMGAGLLRSLALPEFVTADATAYHELAARLARDPAARAAAREKISAAMAADPIFLDPLAQSDAFGRLLETAFDRLVEIGADQFRAETVAITAPAPDDIGETLARAQAVLAAGQPSEAAQLAYSILGATPADPMARSVLGRAFLAQGKAARALDYLLAAAPALADDGPLWFDLARALRHCGHNSQMIEALQHSLAVDAEQLDAWLMLAEIARQMGATDLVHDAAAFARKLAPDDPRVAALPMAPS